MPSRDTLERFIARVESNAHVEAIHEFYAEGASMRENMKEPRVGRDTLKERERRTMERAKGVQSQCVRPVFVQDDRVVIRWPSGKTQELTAPQAGRIHQVQEPV